MGFCLFNNAAVAARWAQAKHGLERVLILDWDVHHGNGTQDIFYHDPSVYYLSLHLGGHYPGTGHVHEQGGGEAKGTTRCGRGHVRVLHAFAHRPRLPLDGQQVFVQIEAEGAPERVVVPKPDLPLLGLLALDS